MISYVRSVIRWLAIIKKMKTILECRPDRNITYFFDDLEYTMFENMMNLWPTLNTGKFSFLKCLDLLKNDKICQQYKMFQNIKKEEKLHEKIENIKGLEPGYIFIEECLKNE